jgi:putative endopeptidase
MMRQSLTLLLAMSIGMSVHGQSAILKSVDMSDLDRSAKSCDNFYDYANGGWRAHNPIPTSMDRWSRRWQAGEANKDRLRTLLDQVSSAPNRGVGTPAQLTGDFYAACTNVKAVDAAGYRPLKPYLAHIDSIRDSKGLQRELSELHAINVMVPFNFGASQDVHAPKNVIADVGAAGLGLPDRDYYVKPDKRFADARAAYLVYVAKMLTLAGSSEQDARASAQVVMRMETALAQASLDNVALRDPHEVRPSIEPGWIAEDDAALRLGRIFSDERMSSLA